MTIREAKKSAVARLRTASDPEAAIDAEILLAHALGISRETMLAHDERPISGAELRRCRALIARRAKREPVAYLVGHREFFGLDFEVNKHTLIPRPETELLVEEALNYVNSEIQKPNSKPTVIDVGTGSGAIAVAIAKNSDARVIATDFSSPALRVAKRNAKANGVGRISFVHADLLDSRRGQDRFFPVYRKSGPVPVSSIVVANLPYLPTASWRKAMPDVKKFEPRSALDGGKDGLRLYDKLFAQISKLKTKPFAVLCEIDDSHGRSFPRLAKRHFPEARVEIKKDLAGKTRIGAVRFEGLGVRAEEKIGHGRFFHSLKPKS